MARCFFQFCKEGQFSTDSQSSNVRSSIIYDKIKKLEHNNEMRVDASKPVLLKNNEDYYYGIVKGYNDYHGLISNKNIWNNIWICKEI